MTIHKTLVGKWYAYKMKDTADWYYMCRSDEKIVSGGGDKALTRWTRTDGLNDQILLRNGRKTGNKVSDIDFPPIEYLDFDDNDNAEFEITNSGNYILV